MSKLGNSAENLATLIIACVPYIFLIIPSRSQTSVESLREDFEQWLVYYNTERPHRGYRTPSKRPLDPGTAICLRRIDMTLSCTFYQP